MFFIFYYFIISFLPSELNDAGEEFGEVKERKIQVHRVNRRLLELTVVHALLRLQYLGYTICSIGSLGTQSAYSAYFKYTFCI